MLLIIKLNLNTKYLYDITPTGYTAKVAFIKKKE